jgi:hypothetical protein
MEQNAQSNPFAAMHKQKLYALIAAGAGFISLLLPWRTLLGYSLTNGFNGAGILALLGVIGVGIASFMGDKTKEFDPNTKMIAMVSFGAIALAALITILTKFHGAPTGSGFGVWLAIIVGLAGLAWVMGFIKIPETKKPG